MVMMMLLLLEREERKTMSENILRKMKREYDETGGGGGNGGGVAGSSSSGGGGVYSMVESGKSKMWEETGGGVHQQEVGGGMDELLAVLGYKVRSSDMAEVALKLEQLEMVMGNNAQEDVLLSHLSSDTVHYNPADLANWVQSMLTEANPSTNFDDFPMIPSQLLDLPLLPLPPPPSTTILPQPSSIFPSDSSRIYDGPNSDYDLRAIPGGAICSGGGGGLDSEREKKRLKPSSPIGAAAVSSSSSSPCSSSSTAILTTDSSSGLLLVDSQETGVRLVHTLMACAEAVQQENFNVADALVKQIGLLAISQAGAMRKVATYFAEALARRIYRVYPQESLDSSSSSFNDILEMHFYETCPNLKFAHFTANQAILEAFAGKDRVHVIDFSMKQGMQWPALMQALAVRPGGPPTIRLTGIGPPQADNSDALQQVGWRLAQFAAKVEVQFEYKGFVANSLADLDAIMLDIRPGNVETVAVNSVFELHRLLAQPGRIEKVLSSIKAMNPKIVTIVEQEADHNGSVFMDRFTESLHYYSTLFDSLEGCSGFTEFSPPPNSEDQIMSEVYLGRQICNVVACEGVDRVERHEKLTQWRVRMESAGFKPVHIGSNVFKQASMLCSLYAGGNAYRVEENHGCLMLGWHTRPLIATSAWQLNSDTESILTQ